MKATNSIKDIFLKLDAKRKDEVRKKISDKYNVSIGTVNNYWIYDGEIPDKNRAGVLRIVKGVAQLQVKEIQKLIDVV